MKPTICSASLSRLAPVAAYRRAPCPQSSRIVAVPEICRFLGIVIMINYNEHDPPHFHARYGRQKISVRVADDGVTGDSQRKRWRTFLSGGTFIAPSWLRTGISLASGCL